MLQRCFVVLVSVLVPLLSTGCGGGSGGSIGTAPPFEALALEVDVEQGTVRGVGDDSASIYQYLGLPYAQPPLGELRWQAPRAAQAWSGVRDAAAPGNACIQAEVDAALTESEDCLYLNIAAPAARPEQLRPVMVWFHGGGDDNGAGHEALYAIDKLAAATGNIVVSVNARLGFLGFMALPELKAESATNGAGNYHHLDQQAALRWVQDNIRQFNGDADNVTIFGESAGANGVCRHLASSTSHGLFQRAILQSSTCGDDLLRSEALAFAQGEFFAGIWGCANAQSRLECLRAQSPEALRDGLNAAGKLGLLSGGLAGSEQFRPRGSVDGDSFSGSLSEGVSALPSSVDAILGVTSNEMTLFLHTAAAMAPADEAAYRAALASSNPRLSDVQLNAIVQQQYPCAAYPSCADAYAAVLSDYVFVCPSLNTADALAAQGNNVYFYEFARSPNNAILSASIGGAGPNAPRLGVPHASELFYLWDFSVLHAGDNPEQTVTALQQYWGSFAASGAPAANGEAQWPRYSAQAQEYLRIGETTAAQNDLRLARCAFINSLDR